MLKTRKHYKELTIREFLIERYFNFSGSIKKCLIKNYMKFDVWNDLLIVANKVIDSHISKTIFLNIV